MLLIFLFLEEWYRIFLKNEWVDQSQKAHQAHNIVKAYQFEENHSQWRWNESNDSKDDLGYDGDNAIGHLKLFFALELSHQALDSKAWFLAEDETLPMPAITAPHRSQNWKSTGFVDSRRGPIGKPLRVKKRVHAKRGPGRAAGRKRRMRETKAATPVRRNILNPIWFIQSEGAER